MKIRGFLYSLCFGFELVLDDEGFREEHQRNHGDRGQKNDDLDGGLILEHWIDDSSRRQGNSNQPRTRKHTVTSVHLK